MRLARRTETRVDRPFPLFNDSLKVKVGLLDGELNAEPVPLVVAPQALREGLKVNYEAKINVGELKEAFGDRAATAQFIVSLKDHGAKQNRVLLRTALTDGPLKGLLQGHGAQGIPFSGDATLTFAVILGETFDRMPRLPHYRASTVAQVDRQIYLERDNSQFPLKLKKPSDFVAVGLPGDTFWIVRPLDAPVTEEIDGVVEVWVNEDAFLRFERAATTKVGERAFKLFAASIYAAIASHIIRAAELDMSIESGSALSDVLRRLQSLDGAVSLADLKADVEDAASQRINALAQALFDVTPSLRQL